MSAARKLLNGIHLLRENVEWAGNSLAARWQPLVADTGFRASARNLAHYLAFRRHDLRPLQKALSPLGLSSLGRCEAHVLPTLDAVLATLSAIAGRHKKIHPERPSLKDFTKPEQRLAQRAAELLGPESPPRSVRIMVTLPAEAAKDKSLVRKLIEAGTTCMRINCAHDDHQAWERMIRHVRSVSAKCKRPCQIMMDLTGPRARTEWVLKHDTESRVHLDDRIQLTRGKPVAARAFPFQAQCSLPEIIAELKPQSQVCFNEGRIRARVERLTPDGVELRVVDARHKGEKFRADMALNFPGTDLHIPPLTVKDLADLDFIVRHADIVGYSFVQRPEDISVLLGELDARRARFKRKSKLGIVAKIETARAVQNLPDIIVRAAGRGPFGVMIARGDLAVEVGYLRVAELQEEILWLSEAAGVPVIWATQVLETLAKKGVPTRAEITDTIYPFKSA